jgi:hypothetical protein
MTSISSTYHQNQGSKSCNELCSVTSTTCLSVHYSLNDRAMSSNEALPLADVKYAPRPQELHPRIRIPLLSMPARPSPATKTSMQSASVPDPVLSNAHQIIIPRSHHPIFRTKSHCSRGRTLRSSTLQPHNRFHRRWPDRNSRYGRIRPEIRRCHFLLSLRSLDLPHTDRTVFRTRNHPFRIPSPGDFFPASTLAQALMPAKAANELEGECIEDVVMVG